MEKKNADAYDKKVLLQITHAILNRMRYEILKYIRWKWVCVNWDMDRKKNCENRMKREEKNDYEDNIVDVWRMELMMMYLTRMWSDLY